MNVSVSNDALVYLLALSQSKLDSGEILNLCLLPAGGSHGVEYHHVAISATTDDPRKSVVILDSGTIVVPICIQSVEQWRRTSLRIEVRDNRLWVTVRQGSMNLNGRLHMIHSGTHVRITLGKLRFDP